MPAHGADLERVIAAGLESVAAPRPLDLSVDAVDDVQQVLGPVAATSGPGSLRTSQFAGKEESTALRVATYLRSRDLSAASRTCTGWASLLDAFPSQSSRWHAADYDGDEVQPDDGSEQHAAEGPRPCGDPERCAEDQDRLGDDPIHHTRSGEQPDGNPEQRSGNACDALAPLVSEQQATRTQPGGGLGHRAEGEGQSRSGPERCTSESQLHEIRINKNDCLLLQD